MNALVHVQGQKPTLPTVLGSAATRIPTSGKIRAGIMVLTRKAAEHEKAVTLYERGVAAGQSFETIEKTIVEALPELKHPLTPKNVPYFTVRASDFPNPEVARQIMARFGEDRGDGERRLYRFPVVFPADLWQTVMPHEMVAWGASGKKYWSEYSEDGATRYCKTYAPVPMDASGTRAIRIFGGRKTTLRDVNGGVCDPENCKEYQSRACNLSGRFIFFIPGIQSLAAIELPTNSFYAMSAAIERFQMIAFMRGGRISGFLDGKNTPFYLSKKLIEVAHVDESGRPCRVKQWIIDLEAPVDVTALLRPQDDELLLSDARAAARTLEGRPVGGGDVVDMDTSVQQVPAAGTEAKPANPAAQGAQPLHEAPREIDAAFASGGSAGAIAATGAATVPQRTATPASASASAPRPAPADGPTVEDVLAAVARLGVDTQRFEQFAAKKWGAGWKAAAGGRRRALACVDECAGDGDQLGKRIAAELDVFA